MTEPTSTISDPERPTGGLCPVCTAAQELLDAEEAYRLAPTEDNGARLARAREAVQDAIDGCEMA